MRSLSIRIRCCPGQCSQQHHPGNQRPDYLQRPVSGPPKASFHGVKGLKGVRKHCKTLLKRIRHFSHGLSINGMALIGRYLSQRLQDKITLVHLCVRYAKLFRYIHQIVIENNVRVQRPGAQCMIRFLPAAASISCRPSNSSSGVKRVFISIHPLMKSAWSVTPYLPPRWPSPRSCPWPWRTSSGLPAPPWCRLLQ